MQSPCPQCGAAMAISSVRAPLCESCGWTPAKDGTPDEWRLAHQERIRELARRHRQLSQMIQFLIAFLIGIFCFLLIGAFVPLFVIGIVAAISAIVIPACVGLIFLRVWQAQTVDGHTVIVRLFTLAMLLIPIMNLMIMAAVCLEARAELLLAGLKTGSWGMSDQEVVERLSRDQCRQCGYCLFGNTSGICPECGLAISNRQMDKAVVEL